MDWFLYDNGLRYKELNNYNVTNSKCKKILVIKIDHKLTFNTHLKKIYKKNGERQDLLSKVIPNIDQSN